LSFWSIGMCGRCSSFPACTASVNMRFSASVRG
jgi:hypothetical protein